MEKILCLVQIEQESKICILKRLKKNSSKVVRITYGKGNYATPVWSPRGDYIAFTKSYRNSFFIGLIKTRWYW